VAPPISACDSASIATAAAQLLNIAPCQRLGALRTPHLLALRAAFMCGPILLLCDGRQCS
jgi:hypothetical protein